MSLPVLPRAVAAITEVIPVIALGAAACVAIVALSLLMTGTFVFEGAASPGEQEHVSPYFGGVIGAAVTTALVAGWRLLDGTRARTRVRHR